MNAGDGNPEDLPRRPRGRRRGPSGARGEILLAARNQFSSCGFDGTTLRAVGAAAGVDSALVVYFFGSKRGLFRAAMEPPAGLVDTLRSALAGPRAGAGDRLATFVVHVLEDPGLSEQMEALVRSAVTDPAAAGMLADLIDVHVTAAICEALDTPNGVLQANLIGSALGGLILGRQILGLKSLEGVEIASLRPVLGRVFQTYLTGPIDGSNDLGGDEQPFPIERPS